MKKKPTPQDTELRDFFAGMALAGLQKNTLLLTTLNESAVKALARSCWDMADAMLEARDSKKRDNV